MKKIISAICAICICLLLTSYTFAQGNELEKHVGKGVELHDKGDYHGAIREFEKALSIDANSPLANSEIANTYFALKDYDKAIAACDKVIAAHDRYVDNAYVTKGSCLDMQGKPQEAITVYKKGIEDYPKNYFLYYNLALTSYAQKEYEQTEDALKHSLRLNPSHSSSHLMLGYLMNEKGDRVKSLLALYNFLLLEPTSERAKSALAMAQQEMQKGVVRESDKKTSIFIPGNDLDTADGMSTANFWLSMLEAGKDIDKNKNKSDIEMFMENSKAFLGVLGSLKKNSHGFWWNYYADFYTSMFKSKDREEAFGYMICTPSEDKKVFNWIKKNKSKIDELAKWYDSQERKR